MSLLSAAVAAEAAGVELKVVQNVFGQAVAAKIISGSNNEICPALNSPTLLTGSRKNRQKQTTVFNDQSTSHD